MLYIAEVKECKEMFFLLFKENHRHRQWLFYKKNMNLIQDPTTRNILRT